ncbi:hypothetical protein TWF481_000899 [Arthrobotrys musiformis]|uniref:Uncharacterized protein n=1 Tax=Arthrobotrys musiformis TaxID=47236 RepID=A0AAV9WP22_9PEZI
MAFTRPCKIQIPLCHLPAGEGLLPAVEEGSHIDKIREAISNKKSGKSMYSLLASMGESTITVQLRQLARQSGAGNLITTNRCWKNIGKTIVSEEQLLILSEHYRLREHLLPNPSKCKRWMNTSAYTSKLFLVYVAGYLRCIGQGASSAWIRSTIIVVINGMIDECLRKRIQIGIPKLVQEYPISPVLSGRSSTWKPLAGPNSLGKSSSLEEVVDSLTLDELLEIGWKYKRSIIEMSDRLLWHVVLFTDGMKPISVVRECLGEANVEATKAAAEAYCKLFLT